MKLFRVLYLFLNTIIIGVLPQSTEVFSGTLLMFGLGMLYDYAQVFFTSNNNREILFGKIGCALSALIVLFSIFGFMKCIEMIPNEEVNQIIIKNVSSNFVLFDFNFKYIYFIRCLQVFPIMAGIELFLPVKRARVTQTTQQPA